jgi:hypothetical protein
MTTRIWGGEWLFSCLKMTYSYMYVCIHIHIWYMHMYSILSLANDSYVGADTKSFIDAYIHTYILTYIHTYIHTYIRSSFQSAEPVEGTYIFICTHTNKHTYIHTYTCSSLQPSEPVQGTHICTYMCVCILMYIYQGKWSAERFFPLRSTVLVTAHVGLVCVAFLYKLIMARTHGCKHVCVYVCTCIFIHWLLRVLMSASVCVCMYVYVYV